MENIELSASLNILGLLFDVGGVVLLFVFGLPPKVDPEGNVHLLIQSKNPAEVKKAHLYKFWGLTGLGLLIFGFCLQAAGSLVVLNVSTAHGAEIRKTSLVGDDLSRALRRRAQEAYNTNRNW